MKINCRELYPKGSHPFSDELCEFMDKHLVFYHSLKLYNSSRFKFLKLIGLSHLPQEEGFISKDEIIGMFYFDTKGKRVKFKQDYVVNVEKKNKIFISYTTGANGKSGYVKSIHDFYKKYGKQGKYYHKTGSVKYEHHYNDIEDLPNFEGLKSNAKKIMKQYKK